MPRRVPSAARPGTRGPGRFAGLIKPHEAFPAVARLDRTINDWTNRRALGSRADEALVAVSTLANRSVLWAGIGVGLAATGRRGRNAALRGYLSLAASSALANLVGKTLFGGERPSLEPVPLWRRLLDPPTSPSFPSGHAASAAAFTTGVAIEWPAVGLALAPVAGSVAYSRLHTGSHWFSDVVAGAALGTGVALLGRVLVPRSIGPRADVPAGQPAPVPALPDGAGLFVAVNTAAGSGRLLKQDPVEAIGSALPAADLHVLTPDDDLGALFDEAAARGARALGISGGDGTVSTAAAAARRHGLPLAVFPGGTLNHFAKAADVTSMAAATSAVRGGTGVLIDVADLEIEGREPITVLNTFSLGAYPELVTEREKHEHQLGKWPAAVLAAARVLRRARPVCVDVDGARGEYWTLFAGVNRYYPQTLAPVERERLDDGVLDVRTARAERTGSRLRTFLEVVAGDRGSRIAHRLPVLRNHLVVSATTAPRLELRFGGGGVQGDGHGARHDDAQHDGARHAAARPAPVILAHDGETLELPGEGEGTALPAVTLAMRKGALRIYAPLDPTAG